MEQAVSFSYFYGEESEQFSFYRIPRLLVTGAQFKNLSTDAKLLYGLLLDRMGLSAKNGWYDEQGRVYIYYPLDEIETDLNCSHGKAVRLMAELDTGTGIGLIERVRQGLGRPSIIYVKQFTTKRVPAPQPDGANSGSTKTDPPEVPKWNFKTSENRTSGSIKMELQEVPKEDFSYYCNIYPDNSYLYPSIHPSEAGIDGMDREVCKAQVRENIGYAAFSERQSEVDELVELITDVLCSTQATFRIGGTQFKSQIVRERLLTLRQAHVEYVLDCMAKNTTKIHNIRGYLLTVLYNAPTTMEHYYQAEVQHDLYGQHSGP